MTPKDLLYAPTHEWLRVETDAQGAKTGVIGITDFAVQALTDLVYIELPKVGQKVTAGQPFGEVESVKAVSDLYSPVDGEIVAANAELRDQLEKLGADPFGDGWIIKVKISDESGLAKLMDRAAYEQQCAQEG